MSDIVTAVTPLLQRFEQWRIDHGRDPQSGRPVGRQAPAASRDLPPPPPRPLKTVDPKHLIVMALKMAADRTHREDLRPLYRELAELFEASV